MAGRGLRHSRHIQISSAVGYLRSPRWFSWAWTRDGKGMASIKVETRSYGEDWSDVESVWPSPGRRACSVASGPGLCVRSLQTGCIAVAGSPSCTEPDACSPAVTAIGLPTQASRNRPVGRGLGNHKRSECDWAEARTCLRSSPTSRRACTGGPTSDGAAFTMLPRSDGAADHCSNGAAEGWPPFFISDPACCAFITPW